MRECDLRALSKSFSVKIGGLQVMFELLQFSFTSLLMELPVLLLLNIRQDTNKRSCVTHVCSHLFSLQVQTVSHTEFDICLSVHRSISAEKETN